MMGTLWASTACTGKSSSTLTTPGTFCKPASAVTGIFVKLMTFGKIVYSYVTLPPWFAVKPRTDPRPVPDEPAR